MEIIEGNRIMEQIVELKSGCWLMSYVNIESFAASQTRK